MVRPCVARGLLRVGGCAVLHQCSVGLSAERKKEVDASGQIVDVFSGAFESYQQGKGNKGIKSDISCLERGANRNLPYGEEIYLKTQAWIRERGIFSAHTSVVNYATAVAS